MVDHLEKTPCFCSFFDLFNDFETVIVVLGVYNTGKIDDGDVGACGRRFFEVRESFRRVNKEAWDGSDA